MVFSISIYGNIPDCNDDMHGFVGMGRFHNGVDSNRFQNRTVQASESTLESTQSRLHYTKIKMFHRKNYNNSGVMNSLFINMR